MTRSLVAQTRTLQALHITLFAPQFRALEDAGKASAIPPTTADIIQAAYQTLEWHRERAGRLAVEITERQSRPGNPVLLAEAIQDQAHHEAEIGRIEAELAALTVPSLAAAE